MVILTGPEGGLSRDEIEQAVAAGFQAVSLGPRILRTETATIAAIAILQARFGDF
jgi:16S rRNA (uracil1498-N3)-methyltransferase